jgi:two-component sensor histidine kinase
MARIARRSTSLLTTPNDKSRGNPSGHDRQRRVAVRSIGRAGPIEIRLIEDRTHLQLIVADKGIGKVSSRQGFGTIIMEKMVAQLGGELTYGDNYPGLQTSVKIPIRPQ